MSEFVIGGNMKWISKQTLRKRRAGVGYAQRNHARPEALLG